MKDTILSILILLSCLITRGCAAGKYPVEYVSDINELALSSQSRFVGELNKNNYPEVNALRNMPIFRWDFSGEKIYPYKYEQEIHHQSDMEFSEKDLPSKQIIYGNGDLVVKSHGDHTANLVLTNMKMSMQIVQSDNGKSEIMEQTSPPVVVQGMEEDGSASFGDSSQEMFFRILFPLPSNKLDVGKSIDIPTTMPFNAMGSLLYVNGKSHLTLTKYVKLGERTCAQFNTDIDISELKVPSELKGNYSCFAKGASVFYFDIQNRCFVSGKVALLMQFKIDAPTLQDVKIDTENIDNMSKSIKMSMVSDNILRVNLMEKGDSSFNKEVKER